VWFKYPIDSIADSTKSIDFIYLFKYRVLSFEKFNGVKKKSSNILLFFKKIQTKKKKTHDLES
jgi:hypothetical protein